MRWKICQVGSLLMEVKQILKYGQNIWIVTLTNNWGKSYDCYLFSSFFTKNDLKSLNSSTDEQILLFMSWFSPRSPCWTSWDFQIHPWTVDKITSKQWWTSLISDQIQQKKPIFDLWLSLISYVPHHMKTCFMTYAATNGSDQPADGLSMIRALFM